MGAGQFCALSLSLHQPRWHRARHQSVTLDDFVGSHPPRWRRQFSYTAQIIAEADGTPTLAHNRADCRRQARWREVREVSSDKRARQTSRSPRSRRFRPKVARAELVINGALLRRLGASWLLKTSAVPGRRIKLDSRDSRPLLPNMRFFMLVILFLKWLSDKRVRGCWREAVRRPL